MGEPAGGQSVAGYGTVRTQGQIDADNKRAGYQNTLRSMPIEPPKYIGIGDDPRYKAAAATVDPAELAKNADSSPWLKLALQKQGIEQSNMLDSASRQASTAQASARDSLAMRGGLRSGSAERLAMQGADAEAMAKQGVLNQGSIARAGLGMDSYKNDLGIATFNAGQQQGSNQFNATANINDLQGRNDNNKFAYGEKMKFLGASNTSDAQAKATEKSTRPKI